MFKDKVTLKKSAKTRIRKRIRKKIQGTAERPRLLVTRSNRYLYVQAIDDVNGKVLSAGWHHEYGRCVEIDHGNGVVTKYAHNDKLKVRRGQKVTRGQVIATVGRSGRATAPHVHYEVRINGAPVNPWKYILSSEVVVD